MEKVETEFIRIQKIQRKLSQQFKNSQERYLKDIDKALATRNHYLIERKKSIQSRNCCEIITHPYNNANWMHIAHFVNNQQSVKQLKDIEQRLKQRKKIRDQIQYRKRQGKQEQVEQNDRAKQQNKKRKKVIPWKLMRSMMQKDVGQNKRRMLKIGNNQQENMKHYH